MGLKIIDRREDELPWSLLERQDCLISASFVPEVLFGRAARSAVRLLLQLLGDPAAACVVLERSAPVTRRFMARQCGFAETPHRGGGFCVLRYSVDSQEVEKMED